MNLSELAEKAGYDPKTVKKLIEGIRVRERTLSDICQVLEIDDFKKFFSVVNPSDEMHGQYTKTSLGYYIGVFEVFRRSYHHPSIVRSYLELYWSDQKNCMEFREKRKYRDRSGAYQEGEHYGEMYLGDNSTLVYLISISGGSVRLMTITRILPPSCVMKGIAVTEARMLGHSVPAHSPVVLRKIPNATSIEDFAGRAGEIELKDAEFEEVDRELVEAKQIVHSARRPECSSTHVLEPRSNEPAFQVVVNPQNPEPRSRRKVSPTPAVVMHPG
jgi:hypothetical protein